MSDLANRCLAGGRAAPPGTSRRNEEIKVGCCADEKPAVTDSESQALESVRQEVLSPEDGGRLNLKAGTGRLSRPYLGQTGLKNKATCGFEVRDRPPERPPRQEKKPADGKSPPEGVWTGQRSQLDGATWGHGRRETLEPALKHHDSEQQSLAFWRCVALAGFLPPPKRRHEGEAPPPER